MSEPAKIGLVSESLRHVSEIGDIWRHEGVKHLVENILHRAGGNLVGEFALRQLADVQPLDSRLTTSVGDLVFNRPIGVGPGYDKTGTMARAWQVLGAGHISPGGFTFDPQWGKPMVRLRTFDDRVGDHGKSKSLNSFGFPNPGRKQGALKIACLIVICPIIGMVAPFMR